MVEKCCEIGSVDGAKLVAPSVRELDEGVVVSHSGDHFVLTPREARELREQLTRALLVQAVVEFSEEDG
jgi:hypothetical protein